MRGFLSLSLSLSPLRVCVRTFCALSDFVCAGIQDWRRTFCRILNPKYYFEGVCSVSSNAKQRRANE